MASPSVTWAFSNATTSDATQVNTNFTDLINGVSDGTKDLSINALTVAGNANLNGNVTLGNASADDITFSGSLAASIPVKTNATYNFGSATSALLSVYLGNGTKSMRLLAGTVGTSWTHTFPNDVPAITGQGMIYDTAGTASFRYADKITATKVTTYTATGDETVIPVDGSSAGWTLTLPAAASYTGKRLTIVRTDNTPANAVTIDGNASETIGGATTYALYTKDEALNILCDGSNWIILSHVTNSTIVDAGVWIITSTGGATAAIGNTSRNKVYWSREGKYAHIYYELITTGAGTTGAAGDYLIALPTGIAADTTYITLNTAGSGASPVLSGRQVQGAFGASNNGGTGQSQLFPSMYDSTHFRLTGLIGGSGAVWYTSSAFVLATTAFEIGGWIKIPVANWNP